MDLIPLLLDLVFGAIIGFAIGLSGIGGGVLIMPVLTGILGVAPSVAVGTASLYSLITKSYAIVEHFRLKTIDRLATVIFLSGALPGTLLSSLLINAFLNQGSAQEEILQFQLFLKWLVIGIIALTFGILLHSFFKKKTATDNPRPKPRVVGWVLSLIIGALIGATSIGGGVLIIPVLSLYFGLSNRQTVGTSILIATVLVLANFVVYGIGGQVDYLTAILMSLGSFAGVFYGSRMSVKISDRKLGILMLALIFISGVIMIFGIAGHG